jgi:hypothetical protein
MREAIWEEERRFSDQITVCRVSAAPQARRPQSWHPAAEEAPQQKTGQEGPADDRSLVKVNGQSKYSFSQPPAEDAGLDEETLDDCGFQFREHAFVLANFKLDRVMFFLLLLRVMHKCVAPLRARKTRLICGVRLGHRRQQLDFDYVGC